MNTGQSLFSIGALLLLSLTVLRVNNNILITDSVLQDSKLGVLAISLATSMIEEANKKAFDAVTADDAVANLSSLTSPGSLGPGSWETPDTFNDFDDYNGYTKQITNLPSAEFNISCVVNYIYPNNPDGTALERTWNKKITVTVTSPSMGDTLNLSSVYSYWHFR
ncbi:hypothetical protein BMS3Abin03_02808 [bacterium BMS3Abin03]|nr:hypothetical protein BMS3Abin03_02808 [bacterium BMS3Abin03]